MLRPPAPRPSPPPRILRVSDLRGLAQIATAATLGTLRLAESLHQALRPPSGAVPPADPVPSDPVSRAPARAAQIYRGARAGAQILGQTTDAALAAIEPWADRAAAARGESPARVAVLSVANALLGDRLARRGNPLALPMAMRHGEDLLDVPSMRTLPQASGKLLLLVHGLGMNDLQWRSVGVQAGPTDGVSGRDHGETLAAALGYTPLYLRYNSGLSVAQNGQAMARQLEQLVDHWPEPVEEIAILAHGMGGLVARSAVQAARHTLALRWPARLRQLVFLGTPHHGLPLLRAGERLGSWLGRVAPRSDVARLAGWRSAGMTDLGHGDLHDDDRGRGDVHGAAPGRGDLHADDRSGDPLHSTLVRDPVPEPRGPRDGAPDAHAPLPGALPEGVACFAIAGTLAGRRHPWSDRLVGDGLVPVPSALGEHPDPAHRLVFAPGAQWVATRTHHYQLLGSPAVAQQLLRWLQPDPPAA